MPVDNACVRFGCQLQDLTRQVRELQNDNRSLIIEVEQLRKELAMTASNQECYALWCSAGKHAFDPNDPEAKRTTVEDADGDSVTLMTCGEHTPSILKGKVRKTRTAITRVDDEDDRW